MKLYSGYWTNAPLILGGKELIHHRQDRDAAGILSSPGLTQIIMVNQNCGQAVLFLKHY
jgi:hypothetical protein|tara:strand:- start:4203 stop:4379 length:177 start_codon:yes stop_codon:yes gene_type:complete